MPPPEFDQLEAQLHDPRAVTPEGSIATESVFDGYDTHPYGSSRKRRRLMEDPQVQADNLHQLWADELLDYFCLQGEYAGAPSIVPVPPEGANLDRAIDDKGHTALHWAVAMGDLDIVKTLLNQGASIDVQSKSGETPLMRSVLFTNIYEKQNMERIASLLVRTVNMQDWVGSTVFHHIATTTTSKKKYQCARYYMDCILNKMAEVLSPDQIERILNEQDNQGDTAITIAARNGARKCVRSLIGRNAAVDIPNKVNITADQLIVQLNNRRQERARQLSSSPFQSADPMSMLGGAVQVPSAIPFDPLIPHTSLDGSNESDDVVYRSEPALRLTSHIVPTLSAKLRSLASAIDAELVEKDAELAEAQRVVNMRQAEIEHLQRQADELRVQELEQTAGGTESDEDLQAQLKTVEAECIAVLEAEQRRNLDALYQSPISDIPSGPPDDSLDEEALLHVQLKYAREFMTMIDGRKELVQEVAGNLARAGIGGGNSQQYKRLITGALRVREEELEGLLPEIVEELEMGRGLEGIGV
jgi:transcription factor MBP1